MSKKETPEELVIRRFKEELAALQAKLVEIRQAELTLESLSVMSQYILAYEIDRMATGVVFLQSIDRRLRNIIGSIKVRRDDFADRYKLSAETKQEQKK